LIKVGDLVVRAYAFRELIPGIIVGVISPSTIGEWAFVVMWPDNTTTEELGCELDFLKDMVEDESH